ncbi:MAG: permease-like cell division protein FtsX [bacterium]|nr:permease-like cell division protein FtsX [bacterium]
MLRTFYRLLKFTFQNFFRNFWLSFVTVTIFVLTLIIVNAMIFMNYVADRALESIEDRVEVAVYFTSDASDTLVKSAQGYLLGFAQVRDVRFVSAESALETFIERHAGDDVILSSLDEVGNNPFGHSLVISAESPENFPFLLEAIETPEYAPFIEEKDFTNYEQVIDNIKTLNDRVRVGGYILAGFFTLVAILIIFNTIRVAIYVHRDEIGIMKLVGANDWFVRGPFLLEAVLYSVLALGIVIGLLTLAFNVLDPWMARYFSGIDVNVGTYFMQNAVPIFGTQLLLASMLSLLTTAVAMRRYLRV